MAVALHGKRAASPKRDATGWRTTANIGDAREGSVRFGVARWPVYFEKIESEKLLSVAEKEWPTACTTRLVTPPWLNAASTLSSTAIEISRAFTRR